MQGEVVYLGKQVEQFALVRCNISEILGPAKAASFVSKALFIFSVGSNDLFDFASNDSDIHLGNEQYLRLLQLNYGFYIRVCKLHIKKFKNIRDHHNSIPQKITTPSVYSGF